VFESQKIFGAVEPCLDPELVRGVAEDGAKLPDEVERGHRGLTRDDVQCDRPFVDFAQDLARAAQASERFPGKHHVPARIAD
jgi:hypothetical protein